MCVETWPHVQGFPESYKDVLIKKKNKMCVETWPHVQGFPESYKDVLIKKKNKMCVETVSYTHLTLPTILLV